MNSGIYLIQDNNQLVEMAEQAYPAENLLQELLAKYPSLLAGDQIDSAAPRRWLLISRETTLPSEEDGAGRWSVDHLFLDQDAIPTLVEVKRSNDTRIRREVVGQMLDYAANAIVYLPVETIRSQFEETCKFQERDSEQALIELLGAEADPEEFWQKVKTNLQTGKIRLIFVADEIPVELQRVVEFLNAQMDPAEVLAVEIKQYVGQSLKALVPRVIGQKKSPPGPKPSGSKQWDEPSFLQELETKRGIDEVAVAEEILKWTKTKMFQIRWGKGKVFGIFSPVVGHKGTDYRPISIWTSGDVMIQLSDMQTMPPFNDEVKRMEWLRLLNTIPGVDISINAKSPCIRFSTLKDEAVLKQFLGTLDWAVQEIKAL
ncbi:hypothetical protein FJZ31_00825 [Candidatus Poribacteria bacterium]|nr:hypothetical protein [Candidatus Poribacteria bacterium]